MENTGSRSIPLARVKDSRKSWTCWTHYIVLLRYFHLTAENWFAKLGARVARNPKKTILVSLISVALCSLGLLNLRVENRTVKLFVPQNTPAEKALIIGKPFFSNSLNTRTEDVIFFPKNGTNILSHLHLEEASRVVEEVQGINRYRDLCNEKPRFVNNTAIQNETCSLLNPLEILKGNTHSKESIFRQLQNALSSRSYVMSNGRNAIFNLNRGFSNFYLDSNLNETSASAFRIMFFMKHGETSGQQKSILEWEKSFINVMRNIEKELKYITVSYAAERSLDDAINESSSSDITLVSITFTVMLTFASLALSNFCNPIRGHSWLSRAGVVSTALGILAGIGIAIGIGMPFISLVGVAPFLVVSIGIDDMFIICDEFDRQSKDICPKHRVSLALSRVGATITMTTVTDIIAFFVSASSSFPAIQYFCVFMAFCISIEFLLQITLFVAFLALDASRIHSNRCDLIPCRKVQDRSCCKVSNQASFSATAMRKYATWLLKAPIKVVICIITLGLLAFGIYGSVHVKNEFNRQNLALKGSHYSKYLTASESYFPLNIPVDIQLTEKIDYSDPVIRKDVAHFGNLAYQTGYYLQHSFSWVQSFENFTSTHKISSGRSNFKAALKMFLSAPEYSQHKLDVILNIQDDVIASRITVFTKAKNTAVFQKDAMLEIRNKLSSQSKVKHSIAANEFVYFEQYAVVIREIIISLVSVSVVILVVLIPFCIHPIIILMIFFGFVILIFELLGLMYFWGVDLSVISLINLVMAVGFSVDYSAHVAQAFVSSREKTVNKRIIEALSTIGGSVLFGGISTFLGMSLTGFASSTIFQIFFKMFLGIILFALFNGLALLPVLLSIFSKCINMRQISNLQRRRLPGKRKKKIQPLGGISSSSKNEVISMLGMSTRVPSARNYNEFWEVLLDGKDTISEYPEQRKALHEQFDHFYNPSRPLSGRHYVSRGSYLDQIDAFDHIFFGISATEVKSMDPQQRMLLQGTYEAIEDAGMKLEELQQCCTGVFVGMMNLDFSSVFASSDEKLLSIDQFTITGKSLSIAANRISFALNLTGPSLVVDTACSSSVTALSIACDHLQRRVVDVAIVAAANLIFCPKNQVNICRANMLATDGKCKVFDERADGYGRGEAIVAFILKASDFVDGKFDPHGEILGWGINNDGQNAAPITAPSVEGQVEVMSNVLQQANVNLDDVQYLEMHGTGTVIGDLVETRSVGAVYGKSRAASTPLLIGSVKSNINHTESAASLAGLAKVCLMMKYNTIVPTAGIKDFAARLNLEEKGLKVQTEPCDWPEVKGKPKVAGINSFGFGGSNGHLLVREPRRKRNKEIRYLVRDPVKLFVLSARSKAALLKTAETFSAWMRNFQDTNENQTDVCYSLNERRTNHGVRIAVAAGTLSDAAEALGQFSGNAEMKRTDICSGKVNKNCSKVAFVFGGQGSQWVGMAGDLLQKHEIRDCVTKIDDQARKRGHRQSLLTYLTNDRMPNRGRDHLVTEQLSIFALQYSVAKFLSRYASIIPVAVTGHSLGDITAACVAGIISSNKAVKIIIARASLQNQCTQQGAMAAVGLSMNEVKDIFQMLELSGKLGIAAENDARNVTISGDADAIDRFEEHVKGERGDVFWRRLQTSKAFHSHHMNGVKKSFISQINQANIKPKVNEIVFYSTTEGRKIHGTELDKEYWWRNLRNPVLFHPCVKEMLSDGIHMFIEISPRPVLSHYLNSIGQKSELEDFTVIQGLPKKDEGKRLHHLYAQCIGRMYTLGYPVTLDQIQHQRDGNFVRYPLYSWQETTTESMEVGQLPNRTYSLLGVPKILNTTSTEWVNEIDLYKFDYLKDHEMKTAGIILPGALYVEMALEAALGTNFDQVLVKDLVFHSILPMSEELIRMIRCSKTDTECRGTHDFKVMCQAEQGDITLATAKLATFTKTASKESFTLSQALTPVECITKDSIFEDGLNANAKMLDANEISISKSKSMNGAIYLSSEEDTESSGIGTSVSLSGASSLGESMFHINASRMKDSSSKDSMQSASSESSSSQNDSLKSASLQGDSSESFSSLSDSSNHLVSSSSKTVALLEERTILNSVGLSDAAQQLTAREFKELAGYTGFSFGDNFSLIDHAWYADRKAVVRLSIPNAMQKKLQEYIIHPCIIDACMQARIPIKLKDADAKKIPVGIKSVRLRQISRRFKHLYCYAEISEETEDICNAKLLDDKGNIIMYIDRFELQDVSRKQRYPSFQESIYEVNWRSDYSSHSKQISQGDELDVVIVSMVNNAFIGKLLQALSQIGVLENRVYVQEVTELDMALDFVKGIETYLEMRENKNVILINLLPTSANDIAPDVIHSSTAHWLCFESTLELLKLLKKLTISQCKLVAFTCQSIGYDMFDNAGYNFPWAATVLGLGRVSFLESDITVIPVDISNDASKNDFVNALQSIDMPAIEEGCIISSAGVHRPKFERIGLKQIPSPKRSSKSIHENFYLSWSEADESYCIKGTPGDRISQEDGFVDITVTHISTPAGQFTKLLQNVKSSDSCKLQQTVVGKIIATSDKRNGLKVGDEVIAILNSKWIKDRIQLPTIDVFQKPEFLTCEEAAVLPACIALANDILARIMSIRQATKTFFIVPTISNQGLCWVISEVARTRGHEVIFSETMEEDSLLLSKNPMEEISKAGIGYDCVICSSELHPVDDITLINTVKQDGIIVILDTENKQASKSYSLTSPVTIIYEKPYTAKSTTEHLSAEMRYCIANLEPCFMRDLPAIQCTKITEVCELPSFDKLLDESSPFGCLKVSLDEDEALSVQPPSMDVQGLKDDRSYIVIGGTKGIGLETVRWMASRGAGTILTVARSKLSDEAKSEFDQLQLTYGANIRLIQADVGTIDGIKIIEQELDKVDRLAGIVNSAVVLDDKLLQDIDRENYTKIMGPKVNGTLLLHNMLERNKEELDFFILYSSIVALIGNHGQATYGAANAFLNSFAEYRMKVLGKPCTAVCWGAMGGGGLLERSKNVAQMIEKSGMYLLDIPTGLQWMEKAMVTMPQKSSLCICDIDWQTFRHRSPKVDSSHISYSAILQDFPEENRSADAKILSLISKERSREKQREIILAYIIEWLANWVKGSEEEIDCNVALFTYGIDSVGSSELKSKIEFDLQIAIEAFYLMQPNTTADKLANDLLTGILDKMNANIIEEAVPRIEPMVPEDCRDVARVDEEEEDEDMLILPDDYLSPIFISSEANANFYMVHPAHRYAGIYQALAGGMQFQKTFSLYAFGSQDPAYQGEDIGSVRRLAKACVSMLLEKQPHGPYFLGGYSSGGMYSLEMATMLQNAGKEVALLVMIDTYTWISKERSNLHQFLDMFEEVDLKAESLQEKMKPFFRRIATTSLKIKPAQYQEIEAEKSLEELEIYIRERAESMSVDIPDTHAILHSTKINQALATRCHEEWVPPGSMYKGPVLFVKAEDDRFCKEVPAIGTNVDCWKSMLPGDFSVVKVLGHHFSIMTGSRAIDVGNHIAVHSTLRYRSLFPNIGRTPQNTCHKDSLEIFKSNGLRVCFVVERGSNVSTRHGIIKLSHNLRKIVFKSESSLKSRVKIQLARVVHISKENLLSTNEGGRKSDVSNGMYSGICLQMRRAKGKFKIICYQRQDYRKLVSLLEAIYRLNFPF